MLCLRASCGLTRQSLTSQHTIILRSQLYPFFLTSAPAPKTSAGPLKPYFTFPCFNISIYSKTYFLFMFGLQKQRRNCLWLYPGQCFMEFSASSPSLSTQFIPLSSCSSLSPSVNLPVLQSPLILLSKNSLSAASHFCKSIVGSQWVYGGSRSAWKHKRGGGRRGRSQAWRIQ